MPTKTKTKRKPRLKINEVAFSTAALALVLRTGGEDLAVKLLRHLQRTWTKTETKPGSLSILSMDVLDAGAMAAVFPLSGALRMAVVTGDEAETAGPRLTGQGEPIRLHRMKL